MRVLFVCICPLIAMTGQALAQPSPPYANPAAAPAPADAAESERPSDYLRAAQGALAAGRYHEAQDALEMAQTRMLDRSVPLGQTNSPSDNPMIGQISQARQAVAAHDREVGMQLLQAATRSASAQGL